MRRGFLLPALLVLLAVLLSPACGGEATLVGTSLEEKTAPDFSLTDHRGRPVALSDFRGQAVALTFIYTNCPDVCPLLAARLAQAYERLPAETRADVALLAVSVDPERDTPEALREFSSKFGLADNPSWHAITGERAVLEQVWSDYYIGVDDGTGSHDEHDHDHGGTPSATPDPREMVMHTDAIFIIDSEGRQRVLMRVDTDPDDIAANLKSLAG